MNKEDANDSLGCRMKQYESKTTEVYLEPDLPLYARIDGRAFHTLCRGFDKPFDPWFIDAMKMVTCDLIKESGACIGYVQSDEISLCWTSASKAPFEGRLFKLTSVLASIASASLMKWAYPHLFDAGYSKPVASRIVDVCPSFDCRVINMPSLEELSNMLVWRQNDCKKNAISSAALAFYSHNELQGKNGDEKIKMINEKLAAKNDSIKSKMPRTFFTEYPADVRLGSFFRRVNVLKKIDFENEYAKFIKPDEMYIDGDGDKCVMRSEIREVDIPYIPTIENRLEALFEGAPVVLKPIK